MWGSSTSSTSRDQRSVSAPIEITVRDLDAERRDGSPVSTPLSMGWLLRLFRSQFFDAFMAVTYLYRYRDAGGVHDYLCNQLYALADADLETFMPQVCNLLVYHAQQSPALERFVLDKCGDSMHIALQVFWFLQAAVEDASRKTNKATENRVRLLRTRCETAAVNGSKRVMLAAAAERISAATLVAAEPPFSPRARHVPGKSLFSSSSAEDLTAKDLLSNRSSLRSNPGEADHQVRTTKDSEGDEGTVDEVGLQLQDVSLGESALQPNPNAEGHQSSDSLDNNDHSNQTSSLTRPYESAPITTEMTLSILSSDRIVESSSDSTGKRSVPDPEADFDPLALLAMKQERFDYFNDSVSIAKAFICLSLTTRELPNDQRKTHLVNGLNAINDMLLRRMKGESCEPLIDGTGTPDADEVAKFGMSAAVRSIHLPLMRASTHALRILRVHAEEAVILTSRTRTPYLVNIEVLPTDMLCSDKLLFCEHRVEVPEITNGNDSRAASTTDGITTGGSSASTMSSKRIRLRRLSEMTPSERQRANVRKVVYRDPYTTQPEEFAEAETRAQNEKIDEESMEIKTRQAVILGVYGELWSWKEERILKKSPFKHLKGTKLMPFIVKGGDDLRQEQLAIQLISQFQKIFYEEKVDVYLKAFTVMSVSSEAGFVEVIKDAVSVHTLKKRTPNFISLLDYFQRAFGKMGSDSFIAAQRRFIRSMAGYSLVTYFLQIKDRHNGNIMIDAKGRIIHIDFGFMLTNSPGAIKFESVPFKLTEEYLQVICGMRNVQDVAETCKTEGYRYFQELFVLGLLAARKHYEKITTLVEIMTEGTTMPCMTSGQSSGQAIVEALRGRFAVGMPEEQCISFALSLIDESRLSWRSAGYDRFQAYSNGYR